MIEELVKILGRIYSRMDDEVTNNIINGQCSHCGQCCGMFIPFTNKEIKEIKRYVKKHNIKPVTDRETPNGFEARCCFYDKVNKKCNIYPVRPYVCRDFMCNHKDWRQRRDRYELLGSYNSSLKTTKLASFDDLIYEDYFTLLRFIVGLVAGKKGNIDSKDLLNAIKYFHREDLLAYIKAETEDGKILRGKEL